MGNVVQLQRNKTETKFSNVTGALEELTNYIKILESKNDDLQEQNEKLRGVNPCTKMFDELPDILTAQNIADHLHISRYTAYQFLKISPDHGGIKSFEVGKSVRCEKSDFAHWLKEQKEKKAHGVRSQAREK